MQGHAPVGANLVQLVVAEVRICCNPSSRGTRQKVGLALSGIGRLVADVGCMNASGLHGAQVR